MPSAGAASTMGRMRRGAALVPGDAWATPRGRPAAVAVHDDGDVHHASRRARANDRAPVHTSGCLHQDEQRDDRADGDREPRVALEEERVAEEHEEHELRQPRLRDGEARCPRPAAGTGTTRNTLTIDEMKNAA